MCIIIDTNVLSSVFDKKSAKHQDFKPVLDWILFGNGFLVYGGSKYIEEIGKTKYRKIFNLFKTKSSKKICVLDKELVDTEQKKIEDKITDPDFDDPHLPAIVIVGKCKLICSEDERSIKFVTNKDLYQNKKPPCYYKGSQNQNLLCDKYIDKKYKSPKKITKKLTKKELGYIETQIEKITK